MHNCGPGKGVIFGDIDELHHISVSVLVQYLDSSALVTMEDGVIEGEVCSELDGRTHPNEASSTPCVRNQASKT